VPGFTIQTPDPYTTLTPATTAAPWTLIQIGGLRNFIEATTSATVSPILNLNIGDTVEFKAGFKFYATKTARPSAFSDAAAKDPSFATTVQKVFFYTVLDSALILTVTTAAAMASASLFF